MGTAAFVDRDRELAELAALLSAARDGDGAVLLVAGEPGIGKSRLVAQATGPAATTGMVVAWGAFVPGASPLSAWRRVLGQLPDVTADAIDRHGQDDTAHAQFEAVVDLLRRASAKRPVAVVLDDLHWADPRSIDLARFVARSLQRHPVAIIGTYRDTEPGIAQLLAPLLADLSGFGSSLSLAGLSLAGTQALCADLDVPADVDLGQLRDRTNGNPFLLVEVLRLIATGDPAGSGTVPASVQAVLGARLGNLTEATRGVLEAAAVAGRSIDLEVLASVLQLSRTELETAISEAVAARLVTRGSLPRTTVQFAHDLVRENLVEALLPGHLGTLRWDTGRALQSRPDADEHQQAIADHLVAGALADPTPSRAAIAAEACRAAAAASASQHAHLQAAHHLEQLRTLVGEDVPLLLDLASCHVRADLGDEAARLHRRAFELARDLGDVGGQVHAALGLTGGPTSFEVSTGHLDQLVVLDEALAAVGDGDAAARSLLLARRSLSAAGIDPVDRRADLASEAIALAESVGDQRARALALASWCDARSGPDHVEQRAVAADQMIACGTAVDDAELTLLGHRFAVAAALESGRLDVAGRHVTAFATICAARPDPRVSWYVPLWRGMQALLRGDLTGARSAADEVDDLGNLGGSQNAHVLALTLRVGALLESGEAEPVAREARPGLEGMLDEQPGNVTLHAALAQLSVILGDPALARRALDDLSAVDFGSEVRDAEWLGTLTYAAQAAGFLADVEAARRLRELLAPHAGLLVVDGIGAAVVTTVHAVLADLAAIVGDVAGESNHRAAALAQATALAAPGLAARASGGLGIPAAVDGSAVDGNTGDLAAPRSGTFQLIGDVWTVGLGADNVQVPDAKGLHDLAVLLARPGREVHVFDLVGGGVEAGRIEGLDGEARQAYARRILELDDELADAEATGDLGRAERATGERQWLLDELRQATGLGGRDRALADGREKARQAVSARVRYTIRRLEKLHPEVGRHLRHAVRLGTFCAYDPEEPVAWLVSSQ